MPGCHFVCCIFQKGRYLTGAIRLCEKKILNDLVELARREGAIFIKIDPDTSFYTGVPTSNTDATYDPVSQDVVADLRQAGWCYSNEQIQFRNTVVIDLNQPEQLVLANMKQKTRYNIHLAERKGVQIRTGSVQDIPLLYQMYAETSVRDKFVIRDQRYYQVVWEKFIRSGLAQVLIAEVNNEPVAGLILFVFAKKAWYLYGMSRQVHREKMPNHLLQWEAIRVSRAQGCEIYDLWGAPEHFDESDPMWGVYRFKEGLGGKVVRHIGAWDLPIQPNLYKFSMQILPKILAIHRRRGMDRTRHQASI